jgi:hypothetical protein
VDPKEPLIEYVVDPQVYPDIKLDNEEVRRSFPWWGEQGFDPFGIHGFDPDAKPVK